MEKFQLPSRGILQKEDEPGSLYLALGHPQDVAGLTGSTVTSHCMHTLAGGKEEKALHVPGKNGVALEKGSNNSYLSK